MKWLWWVAVVGVLGLGCLPPCNASTCDGCCAEDGSCSAGTSRFECGQGAVACVRCESDELCLAATCTSKFDAGVTVDAGPVMTVDAGCRCATACCLADGSCGTDNDATACGAAKAWCAPCAAGQRCDLGQCVSASCSGCWTPEGRCMPGTTVEACGPQGSVCVGCGADHACSAGACVPTRCDADNCRFGCCQPDKTCVTTVGPLACGLNGTACVGCSAGQSCVSGFCR